MTGPPATRKLMSCTAAEFAASMANVGGMEELPDSTWTGKAGQGTALIRYQSQPGVKLGGLLQIPRAVVTITFDNASEADRTAFLRRFELAFQRGGG